MRKARTAITIAAIAGAGLITASPAGADANQFLDTMHALGFYGEVHGDATLLHYGYATCAALGEGVPVEDVAHYIYDHSGPEVDATSAFDAVLLAAHELCPPTNTV